MVTFFVSGYKLMMLYRIHIGAACLYLLNLLLLIFWGITFRGQLLEQLTVITLFASGLLYLIVNYGKSGRAAKGYFLLYPLYLFLLLLFLFIDRLVVVILLVPFLVFLIPQHTMIVSGRYEIRETPGLLSSAGVSLYRSYFLFEKSLGRSPVDPGWLHEKWSALYCRLLCNSHSLHFDV